MTKTKSVCVVGAGFSGLSLAYWAVKRGLQVRLIEEKDRAGGLLESHRIDGQHLVESAANGFLWSSEFEELERDLGQLFIHTRPESRRRYIFRAGQYRRWPLGIWATLSFVWRLLRNWSSRRPLKGESIRQWGDRILGSTARHYLLETALQGIYAGQGEVLSASLILGRILGPHATTPSKTKRRGTHSHAEGMGALTRDLLKFLIAQRNFEYESGRRFNAVDLAEAKSRGERVMIALPPERAAEVLSPEHPDLARVLRSVEMNSVATMTTIWPAVAGESGLPAGFGVLFPRGEGVEALGVLRNHHIFAGRSDRVSETWIYSGASLRVRGIWENSEGLKKLIEEERFRLTGKRLAPESVAAYFWDKGIPHYTVQLEKLLPEIERLAAQAEIEVFGNYTGHLGLTRIFAEAKRRVHEGFGNV